LRQTGFRPLFSVRWQLAPDPLHLRPPPATATAAPLRFAIHHFAFNILERFRKSRSHGWKKMEEDDFAPVSAGTTFFGSSSLILPNPRLNVF